MRRTLFELFLAALLFTSTFGLSQTAVTEKDVLDLVGQKVSEFTITSIVSMAPSIEVDTSPGHIIALLGKGVPPGVVDALVKRKTELSSKTSNASASPDVGTCVLQDGTQVRLLLKEKLSSATAKQNDPVIFVVDGDVSVGGTAVIAKGTEAKGHVVTAEKKGGMGRKGKLLISADTVKTADGSNIRLQAQIGDDTEKAINGALALGVFSPLKHGKDIEIAARVNSFETLPHGNY